MKYLDPTVLKPEQGNCNGGFGRRLLTVERMNLVKCPDGLKFRLCWIRGESTFLLRFSFS